MALAIILFAGFVGVALVAVLSVLAFIDVAFNVWESADRADRNERYTVPAGTADLSPRIPQVRARQWAQSA
jgi:hypothetical protein